MTFIGKCPACQYGLHDEHQPEFGAPTTNEVVGGGGICLCEGDCEAGWGGLEPPTPDFSSPRSTN